MPQQEPSVGSTAQVKTSAEGASVRLGGRVVQSEGATAHVADVLGVVAVTMATSTPLAVGALVVVEGTAHGGELVAARLLTSETPAQFGSSRGDVGRLLLGGVGQRLVQRARVLAAMRAHLVAADFVEVETPALVPCPGLDVHLDGCAADGGYLITSPEYQMKRLLVGGMPRIFQLARCFRRGERGAHHNPEFTMLEWYRAFAGYEDVMADTEALVRVAASAAQGHARSLTVDGRTIDLTAAFRRVTVAEAFAHHARIGAEELVRLAQHDEDTYFGLMVERVEPALAALDQPVFLIDYPASQASLARRKPTDPRFSERFELYVAGVELCNGFGELTDPAEQRARFVADQAERQRRGLPVYPLDERFLEALTEGMPPSGGNALGVDRLVALAVGAGSIGAVQSFPADEL